MQSASRSRRRNQTVLTTAAALASFGVLASAARAADIHWDAADANWDTAGSWVGGVVPGNADRGILDRAGGGTAHVTTDIVDVKGISVANGNVLSVETGGIATTLANTPDNVPADGIHIGDGGAGSASVTGSGTLATTGGGYQGTVSVGRATGNGTLTVNGATALVDGNDIHIGGSELPGTPNTPSPGTGTLNLIDGRVNARAWSFVGRDGGTGTFNMSGGTYSSASGQFIVGFNGGTGTYNLSGGTVSAISDDFKIGEGSGSQGTVVQTGGTIIGNDAIFVGNGGTGRYDLSAGHVEGGAAFNDVWIGNGTGGNGVVNQTGGTFFAKGGWMMVGRAGGQGRYNLSDGTLTVNGNLNVGQDGGGVGTLHQTGGIVNSRENLHVGRGGGTGTYNLVAGTLNVGASGVDPDLIVAADGGSAGVFNQSGGEINVSRWGFVGRNNGNGTFNQTGGTYKSNGWMRVAEANGAVGAYNLSGTAVANIGGGDADTGDDDLVVSVDPLTSGTVDIKDNAVINAARDIRLGMEGGNGTFVMSGNADVNVARLVAIGNNQSAGAVPGTGSFTVNGGTLDVTTDINVGEAVNTTGQLTIAGGTTTVGTTLRVGNFGSGVADQSAGTVIAASLIINANPAEPTPSSGDYNLSGGSLTALSTTNNGTLDISNNATASLGPVGGSGSMSVAGTATVAAQHVRQPSLTMTGGKVTIADTGNGTDAGVSRIASYSLTGDARFDLRDNKLLTDQPAGTFTGGAYTGVQGDVQRAYNFGAWDQPGLTTSEDNAGFNAGPLSGTETIGVATASQVLFIGPTDTALFRGQTVTGATTIAMYTYAGDLNFDGLVDGSDYGTIDNWVQFPGTDGYVNGDINYDGVIDGADYGVIDNTVQLQGAPFLGVEFGAGASSGASLSGVSAVPEPSACGFAVLGAAALLARRRRRRHVK